MTSAHAAVVPSGISWSPGRSPNGQPCLVVGQHGRHRAHQRGQDCPVSDPAGERLAGQYRGGVAEEAEPDAALIPVAATPPAAWTAPRAPAHRDDLHLAALVVHVAGEGRLEDHETAAAGQVMGVQGPGGQPGGGVPGQSGHGRADPEQVRGGDPLIFLAGHLRGAGRDGRATRRYPLASSQGHRQVEPGALPGQPLRQLAAQLGQVPRGRRRIRLGDPAGGRRRGGAAARGLQAAR